MLKRFWFAVFIFLACLRSAHAAEAKPLRALLITGGCCHEYSRQKDVLKNGLEGRINLTVDQIHTDDSSTRPPLPFLGNADYAKGYDVVIHDECGSDISDPAIVQSVLAPHRAGLPGVNLHCAMHSYRIGNPNDPVTAPGTPHGFWFEYLGLQSSAHGPQKPISITYTNKENAIVRGLPNWTTVNEELYNNIRVLDGTTPLARGEQSYPDRNGAMKTNNFVVVWTNQYGPKKTRVFSTTIGHNTATVADARYLDLVARGVLWATGHLKEDGVPDTGYARGLK
jgi:hypothetical protein